jgi:hypothetical protein
VEQILYGTYRETGHIIRCKISLGEMIGGGGGISVSGETDLRNATVQFICSKGH